MTWLSVSNVVRISTLVPGAASTICRVASMPSMFGILMSISTTSGLSLIACLTASAPSMAWATTSTLSSSDSRLASPVRKSVWSSTMRTRAALAMVVVILSCSSVDSVRCGLGHRHEVLFGKDGVNSRPRSRSALDLQTAAEEHRPLLHPDSAKAERPGAVGIDAPAVVVYLDGEQPLGSGFQNDAHRPGAAVHPDVGERLLDDAIQVQRGRRGKDGRPAGADVELGFDRRPLLEPGDEVAQRVDERIGDYALAAKLVEELAQAGQNLPSGALDRLHLA